MKTTGFSTPAPANQISVTPMGEIIALAKDDNEQLHVVTFKKN